MSKLLTFILSFFILFFSPLNPIFAASQTLVSIEGLQSLGFNIYESINPDSLIYPFKRLGEKIRFLSPINLLNTRFNELVYIANYQKSGFITEVANRYNTSIGQIKSGNAQLKDKGQIVKYLKILERLRDGYPANSSSWLILQQTLDTTRSIL